MSRRHVTVVLAGLVLLVAAPAGAADAERVPEGKAAADVRERTESDREAKIRKAREDIRKNPAQKKFILFRYDLKEEDL